MKRPRFLLFIISSAILVFSSCFAYANFFSPIAYDNRSEYSYFKHSTYKRHFKNYLPTYHVNRYKVVSTDSSSLSNFKAAFFKHRYFVSFLFGLDALFITHKSQQIATFPISFFSTPDNFVLNDNGNHAGFFGFSLGTHTSWNKRTLWNFFLDFEQFGDTHVAGNRYFIGSSLAGNITPYSYLLSSYTFLLGSEIDFDLFSKPIFPYLEGGIGFSSNTFSNFVNPISASSFTPPISPFPNATTHSFSYMLGTGLNFMMTPCWLLSLGYRFHSLGDIKSGMLTSQLVAGLLNAPIQIKHTLYANEAMFKIVYLF